MQRCVHWPVLGNKEETFCWLQELGCFPLLWSSMSMHVPLPDHYLAYAFLVTSQVGKNRKRIDAILKCKSKVDALRALLVMVQSINIDCRLSLTTRDVALAYRIEAQ